MNKKIKIYNSKYYNKSANFFIVKRVTKNYLAIAFVKQDKLTYNNCPNSIFNNTVFCLGLHKVNGLLKPTQTVLDPSPVSKSYVR